MSQKQLRTAKKARCFVVGCKSEQNKS